MPLRKQAFLSFAVEQRYLLRLQQWLVFAERLFAQVRRVKRESSTVEST